MTCQRCPDEATIHLTETINGKRRELHLCQQCARKAGLALPETKSDLALDKVVQTLIVAHVGELVGALAQLVCPCCGTKFMEFRASGRLGCPHDYQVFNRGLLPLLQRAHHATRHVGKVPGRRAGSDSAARLQLRASLREAVAREAYEEAATLRDQLRQKEGAR
jgi:protein arginine kinase activator